MKRRIFLSAASTVGIVGAVSSATIISSTYTSISESVLLQDFSASTKNIWDNFMTEVKRNFQSIGLDEKLAHQVVMPTQIINNNSKGNITYKNKSGEYISLSMVNGTEKVNIQKTLD